MSYFVWRISIVVLVRCIDGTPAESLDLTEVRKRFRSDRAGGILRLRVQSGGEERDVVVKLDSGIWSERGCALAI